MIKYVIRITLLAGIIDEYNKWARTHERDLSISGKVQMQGYRIAAGEDDVVLTFEFEDMEAWAAWYEEPAVQKFLTGLRRYTSQRTRELWTPSPGFPKIVSSKPNPKKG